MNFYNPYGSFFAPSAMGTAASTAARSGGLLSGLFRNGISWSSIFSNTQKTLNFVNQVIPVVKQATPLFRNARTMWRVMNEFRKSSSTTTQETQRSNTPNQSTTQTNNQTMERERNIERVNNVGPTFFA